MAEQERIQNHDSVREEQRTILSTESERTLLVCANSADNLCGTIIGGHYEIESVIGSGGTGRVYKARHLILDRSMAIKLILPERKLDGGSVQRFTREAQAAIALNHPNICRVSELGLDESGIPYMAMDLIEGRSLSQLIKQEGALNWQRVAKIGMQVCNAMQHAHEHGVIHRDIKPGNIIISGNSDSERAIVVDFGIAKIIMEPETGALQELTKTGDIMGSPLYMSPEQCTGRQLDAKSDIYSLGCLLYEALSGSPPLVGVNTLETLHKHISECPVAIATIPPSLNAVVLKSLQKDSADRQASMSQFCQELEQAISHPNLPGPPTNKQIWRAVRLTINVVLLALLVIIVATISNFYYLSRVPSGMLRGMQPTSWAWVVYNQSNLGDVTSFEENQSFFEKLDFSKESPSDIRRRSDLYSEQLLINRANDSPTIFADPSYSGGTFDEVALSVRSMQKCIAAAENLQLEDKASLTGRFHKIEGDGFFRIMNFSRAESEYQIAIAQLESVREHNRMYAEALSRRGDCFYFQHRWSQASQWYEKALLEWMKIEAKNQNLASVPVDYALSESRLGDCCRTASKFVEAKKHYRNAAAYWRVSSQPKQLAMTDFYLAYLNTLPEDQKDTYDFVHPPFSPPKVGILIYQENPEVAERSVKEAFYTEHYAGLLLKDLYAIKYAKFDLAKFPREVFDKISAQIEVFSIGRTWPLLGDIKESGHDLKEN